MWIAIDTIIGPISFFIRKSHFQFHSLKLVLEYRKKKEMDFQFKFNRDSHQPIKSKDSLDL